MNEPWLLLRLGYHPYPVPGLTSWDPDVSKAQRGGALQEGRAADAQAPISLAGRPSAAASGRRCPAQCRCVRTQTSKNVCRTVLADNTAFDHASEVITASREMTAPALAGDWGPSDDATATPTSDVKSSRQQRSLPLLSSSFCDVRSNVATAYHRSALEGLRQVRSASSRLLLESREMQ